VAGILFIGYLQEEGGGSVGKVVRVDVGGACKRAYAFVVKHTHLIKGNRHIARKRSIGCAQYLTGQRDGLGKGAASLKVVLESGKLIFRVGDGFV
jgi:hypothetical protein